VRTIVRLAAVLLLAAATACGGDSPTEPSAYDLDIELTNIYVPGDCESTPGNPGEFSWRVTVTAPLGKYATEETNGFPAEGGALPYSEDDSPIVLGGRSLHLSGIAASDVADAWLQFSAIEWDGGSYDANMAFRQVSVQAPPLGDSGSAHAVDVGASFSCLLSFEFVTTWTGA
jgi:hypothetical protein